MFEQFLNVIKDFLQLNQKLDFDLISIDLRITDFFVISLDFIDLEKKHAEVCCPLIFENEESFSKD